MTCCLQQQQQQQNHSHLNDPLQCNFIQQRINVINVRLDETQEVVLRKGDLINHVWQKCQRNLNHH